MDFSKELRTRGLVGATLDIEIATTDLLAIREKILIYIASRGEQVDIEGISIELNGTLELLETVRDKIDHEEYYKVTI